MKKILSMLLVASLVLACGAGLAETIKIGFIGPLTGAAALYGTSAMQGAQIAVDEINAAGGNYTIEFNPQDDEHDGEKSVNAYNTLYDWGVQMIVGCVTTNPCIAVSAEANNDRVFMLTPSASSTAVTEDNDCVYQLCFTDPAQGTLSAQFIKENNVAENVAVIYNNADAYSTGIYQKFIDEAAAIGLNVVSATTFTDDTTDFSVQLTDAKDNGADLIFLPIYYTPASMMLVQAAAMEYAPKFFGVDGMDGILNLEGFDTSYAEGLMLLTPFSADAEDEQTANFVAKYQEAYGEVPSQFAADGYDCVYAFVAASEAAGITGDMSVEDCCEALIAAFQTIEVNGVTGTMTWEESGEVTKTPKAVIIENGVYVGM